MTSERIVLLAILTACMFAVFNFSQSGSFLLPFGLFKPGILIVAVILLVNNRSKPDTLGWIMVSWSVFLALTSIFLHQTLYSEAFFQEHAMEIELFNSGMYLFFLLLFFLWQLILAWKENSIFRWLQLVNAALMFACLITEQFVWLVVPTCMWIISVFAGKTVNPIHRSMAGLMAFVIISSWISGMYYGELPIMIHL